ncbi:uncharacterized protein BXZ73DRAFT_110590 [Epithele typhae]|uniref:uncharacterized protein n=1 Tax=Epithele typhae TaxID=378194 RepID=UPI0020086E22|nr:uncharacterized protein BXZ73DRAFT_110590 [Epithele typhae]KAH9906123.1 hypothetical protein BXZ73DRAFT_110590 [Epithele typhae]
MTSTSFASLNEDVLRIIFSFLDCENAHAVSSCSKQLFLIDRPRFFKRLRVSRFDDCWNDDKALSKIDFLYKTGLYGVAHVDQLHDLSLLGFYDPHHIDYLCCLLQKTAAHLRNLEIYYFESFLILNSDLAQVMGAMSSLEQAILWHDNKVDDLHLFQTGHCPLLASTLHSLNVDGVSMKTLLGPEVAAGLIEVCVNLRGVAFGFSNVDTAILVGDIGLIALDGPLSSPGDVEPFAPLLEVARPIALQVHVARVLLDGGLMWNKLLSASPRLRSLEITVDFNADVGDHKATLLDALASTPLVYLSLYFYRWGPDLEHAQWEQSLPGDFATKLSTLRVFAMSARRAGMVTMAVEQDWNRYKGGTSLATRTPRWWRIAESNRTPIEVWREHGECARELIQRADFDPDTSLTPCSRQRR